MKKVLVFPALCQMCRAVYIEPLRARVTRACDGVIQTVWHNRHKSYISSTFLREEL